jgi:hypothetical protein
VTEEEINIQEAAAILGISSVLVIHRMNIGDLPYRDIVGHKLTNLKDVLALKTRLDAQKAALHAMTEDADDLARRYGI